MAGRGGGENKPEYSRLLVLARQNAGLTASQLAERLNISYSSVRSAESGHGGSGVIKSLEQVFPPEIADPIKEAYATFRGEQSRGKPPTEGHDRFSANDVLVPVDLIRGLVEARLTRFYPSRKYYGLLRDGRASIAEYVQSAEHTVEMVSINLATGMDLEGLPSRALIEGLGGFDSGRMRLWEWGFLGMNVGRRHTCGFRL